MFMQEGNNSVKLKKVHPNPSPGLDENDGKIISTWNFGMSNGIKDLETRLAEVTDPQTRINLLNDLAWELRDTDPERSHNLSETAYQLATSDPFEEQIYRNGVITSLRGLAHSSRRAGNLALSLSQSAQALNHLQSEALPVVEVDILQKVWSTDSRHFIWPSQPATESAKLVSSVQ
jgi:hypothetical protein